MPHSAKKTLPIFLILLALIILPYQFNFSYEALYTDALTFGLPFFMFIAGYVVIVNYSVRALKRSMGILVFAPIPWALAEVLWALTNNDGEVLAYSLSFDVFYLLGFAILVVALVTAYPVLRQYVKARAQAIALCITMIATVALGYYFLGYRGESIDGQTMRMTAIYLVFDLAVLFFALSYTWATIKHRLSPFWAWLLVFTLVTIAADTLYGIRALEGTYAPYALPSMLFNAAYAALLVGFLSFVDVRSALLRDVDERYYEIFNHSGAPTIMADGAHNVLLANQQFEQMTGYEEKEVTGEMKWPELVDAKDRKSILLLLNRMENVGTKKPLTRELNLHTKDGSALCSSVTFSFIPETDLIVITIFDLTERKKLENELKRINEDLQNFTFTVSHDLKEPLRNISSLATYLKRDYQDKLDDMGNEFLDMLVNSVSTMSQLVDDLLTLSRIGRKNVDFSFVDINNLINEVLGDIQNYVKERNAEVRYENLPKAMVQKTWIKQVFQNLITNGIKFNDSPQPTVDITYKDHNFFYEFIVRDNGIGIPQEYKDKIFKLFERLHSTEEYGGTGAGLAIVKKIVKEHRGDIWVESEEGSGSTFHFTIEKFFIGGE
ncbi:PAS domain S-box protein [archaeon]|nr:MAG: PAS domain S-box protein [archaeon]